MTSNHCPAKSIFLEAIEHHAPEQWPKLLDHACAGDEELRAKVKQLLKAHAELGPFHELIPETRTGTAETTSLLDDRGVQIGPYRLMESIGEGGMGVVYLAEQRKPVCRTVALKIVKPGLDTRQVVARFEAERQALALMDHPNIARVLDAGATEWGRPYFVMELVRGTPITEYCDEYRRPLRDRLSLFVQVCQAIQHAHQKGIIHRDIKPSNVLVTLHDGQPVPKVIDFGVAKAIHQPLTDLTLYSGQVQILGTPLYMSPEQAEMNGFDVDTRSDVYSLGVLLYELLTGSTPFSYEAFQRASFDEWRRIIREEEPPSPSARVGTQARATVSQRRGVDERRLGQVLRGELDWIVMKALEKNRNRRYESASALAADVERYLQGEAVCACPPSKTYRLRKFAQRYTATLITSAVVVAAMVGMVGVSVWQAARATASRQLADERLKGEATARQDAESERMKAAANFGRARAAVQLMLTRVADNELARIPEMQALHRRLLEDAANLYTELLASNPRDSQTYFERARVYDLLRRYDKVRADYERAIELNPDQAEFHHWLARFLMYCPEVSARDHKSALSHAACAVLLSPRNAMYHRDLGMFHHRFGEQDKAVAEFRQAADLSDNEAERASFLSEACEIEGKRRESVEWAQKGVALSPNDPKMYEQLYQSYVGLGDHKNVIAAATTTIDLRRKVRSVSADNYGFHDYMTRGEAYLALGMDREALADFDCAATHWPFRSDAYKRRAQVEYRLSNFEHALADITKSIELNPGDLSALTWPDLTLANCPDPSWRQRFLNLVDEAACRNHDSIDSRLLRALILVDFGQPARGRVELEAMIGRFGRDPGAHHIAALLALKLGDRALYRRICSGMLEQFQDATEARAGYWTAWTAAVAPEALDDYTLVVRLARQSCDIDEQGRESRQALGAILFRAGRYEEALKQLTRAADTLEQRPDPQTSPAYSSYLLAVTNHRLGNVAEAGARLVDADRQADHERSATQSTAAWKRRLTLELLRREAENLISTFALPAVTRTTDCRGK